MHCENSPTASNKWGRTGLPHPQLSDPGDLTSATCPGTVHERGSVLLTTIPARSSRSSATGPADAQSHGADWAGDPIEIGNRFRLGHGERSYEEMLAHFKDYNDIIGDHPQNLSVTTLALNAYMLDHDARYKSWLLEYVDAWRDRMQANGGIIPTNIGLDGQIGGATQGKWWGGVYGWGFSVIVPQTGKLAHRNLHHMG